MTVPDWLERAATRVDTGLRLLDRAERATWYPWREIAARARATCGGLQRLGVRPGDRVALILPTGIDFFDAFFALQLCGAVPVPLYPPVRLGRLDEYARRTARMLELVNARLVLTDRRVRRLLGPAVAPVRPALGCRVVAELATAPASRVTINDDDLALVQFSSGTTVDPKPVALTHRALVAQTTRLNAFWPDSDKLVHSGVSWLPLYHDMGLIGCVLPALERPGTLTLIPPELFVSRPAVWLRAISRYRATLSPAPNFAYGLCVDKIADEELDGIDLSSWQVALNGAEAVTPGVLRTFIDRFSRWGFRATAMTPVYGLSEAALAVTFSDLDRPFGSRRFNREALAATGVAREQRDGIELIALGRPLPDFSLRIVDQVNADLAADHVGRVLVRGPSLMAGYLDQPTATSAALADGWLDTGDVGFIHDGELYLSGRAKDVLILRGRNHSPHEVEHAVDMVDGIRTGCAVAVSWLPEGSDGERLLVLAEARREVAPSSYPAIAQTATDAIRAACGLSLDAIEILPPGTLPRTSSGKLRRQEALRQWQSAELAPPEPVTPLRLAAAVVRSQLALAAMRSAGEHGR